MRWLVILVLVACAPDVPSPRDRAIAGDLAEDAALERQLRAIPGVTAAHAALHHGFVDPLTGVASPASASVLVTITAESARATVEDAARRLAPGATLAIVVGPAPATPSRTPLAITALVAILAAAGYVAWRTRPRAT